MQDQDFLWLYESFRYYSMMQPYVDDWHLNVSFEVHSREKNFSMLNPNRLVDYKHFRCYYKPMLYQHVHCLRIWKQYENI